MLPHVYSHFFVAHGLDGKCTTLTNQISQFFFIHYSSETPELMLKIQNGVESVELEIQQVDGRKKEEPAWSVTNSRLVIDLYRDNPVLYDKKS